MRCLSLGSYMCYCCSVRPFENCCLPVHGCHAVAETAEQLMRSRYSAYVMGNTEFLKSSWQSGYRPEFIGEMTAVNWCRLEIVSTETGHRSDKEGWVEFKAYFIEHDKLCCLHESSYFVQQHGLWFYQRGETFENKARQISANGLCPCGSTKKYKRCCRI